jgi:DNA-binding NtrC family response regulator
MKSILVVTKVSEIQQTFYTQFHKQYKIEKSENRQNALEKAQKTRFDFICIELDILRSRDLNNDYKEALQPFWSSFPTTEIIVLCTPEQLREAVKVVKAGANTYLNYPINPDELKLIIESIQDYQIMESELDYLRTQFWHSDVLDLIKTQCSNMSKVFDKIQAVATTKSTVLIVGETGSGKGVLANLIHLHSHRKDKPFISVHCGAIPDTLLESELFGYEKGAFTGADRRKLGKFEISQGGTIFLDEIGTITPSAQIKLLNILQDQIFQRIGGEEIIEADVRILAATNTNLKTMCDEGEFRKDLYYRLNVFPIEVPPLRERRGDIPHLAEVILNKMKKRFVKEIKSIHPTVIEAFMQYSWPGNIRELENLIERAYILETSSVLSPESFPTEIFEAEPSIANISISTELSISEVRKNAAEGAERQYLKTLLANRKGKIKASAEAAGISTRQLNKLMNKHGIRKEEFKPKQY